jgi:hypothetical protein
LILHAALRIGTFCGCREHNKMLAHDCLSTLIAPDPLGKSAGNAHKAEPAISIVALKLRRDADAGPFACQSCDNVQGNGDTLRQIVVGLAVMSGLIWLYGSMRR